MINESEKIINDAIEIWKPTNIVCLFSGGYDSQVMAYLANQLSLSVPVHTFSINTNMAADGWKEYVTLSAKEMGINNFAIYDNKIGFDQYVEWVREYGCPRNLTGHNRAYTRLKDRAIDAIHMLMKINRNDKTLFLSGMRKYESARRTKQMTEPIKRAGTTNKIFANPLFWWTDEDVAMYRITHDLPDNPFYNTVKGSGDCQCNWGNFITMGTLKKYSPVLAVGNVAIVDELSRKNHGYGWDGEIDAPKLIDIGEDNGEMTSPFLCSNCSRDKGEKNKAMEKVMLQRGLF